MPRSVMSGLLAAIGMLSLFLVGNDALGSEHTSAVEITSTPETSWRALSGASITFKPQDGSFLNSVSLEGRDVPLLVLQRNGALTDPDERTLIAEATGIKVSPPGVTVTLRVETQHANPDPPEGSPNSVTGRGAERRIPVWQESRWVANTSGLTPTWATAIFTHTFGETVVSGTETVSTPTDYYRYEVEVIHAGAPAASSVEASSLSRPRSLHSSGDHAFLMENQWIARLPEVQEASEGAAPDELVVYYTDMVPFQRDIRDPATRLPRADVPEYVHTKLVPRMVEAFQVQTDDWGFPWHDAWTSYRPGEGEEQLSVALTDGRTWFHGKAPLRGHSRISINVRGGDNAHYETLTDGLISSFHHELFHNVQRNIYQESGGIGSVGGAEHAWQTFSEGTAVLASAVGQPDLQFASVERAYMSHATAFLGEGGLRTDLNRSYERMSPTHSVIYWRFLYEQCGMAEDGSLDPAAGMEVIRRALTILYSGDVVDVAASTDLVEALPAIVDQALAGSTCPFDSHAESLTAFARAIYALRLEGGRCSAPGTPTGCGLYDPQGLYDDPPINTVRYSGGDLDLAGEIPSSFGVDLVDVVLDPDVQRLPLTLAFHDAPGTAAAFNVQVLELNGSEGDLTLQTVSNPSAGQRTLDARTNGGGLLYVNPGIDLSGCGRLGLIITRVDADEHLDTVGAYRMVLRSEAPPAADMSEKSKTRPGARR